MSQGTVLALTKLVEDGLTLALLAPHQAFHDLDELHLQPRTRLHQPHRLPLALLVPAPDVVLRKLHRIRVALGLARLGLGHRIVPCRRCL